MRLPWYSEMCTSAFLLNYDGLNRNHHYFRVPVQKADVLESSFPDLSGMKGALFRRYSKLSNLRVIKRLPLHALKLSQVT